jgi:hypothetical protein
VVCFEPVAGDGAVAASFDTAFGFTVTPVVP